MHPTKINKELIQKSLNKAGISGQVTAAQICSYFDKIILEKNKKSQGHVRAFSFQNNNLVVMVANSLWANEIQMMSFQIVETINEEFGENTVGRIQYKVTD
jgi:predicted nucleic acid-binding Zn ribbon protein